MVQSAPNESVVHGVVRGVSPDPSRPGFVVVEVQVSGSAAVQGPELAPLAAGGTVAVIVRQSDLASWAHGGPKTGDALAASVRLAGPGVFMARDVRRETTAQQAGLTSQDKHPRGEES